jgi:hypothetical protein
MTYMRILHQTGHGGGCGETDVSQARPSRPLKQVEHHTATGCFAVVCKAREIFLMGESARLHGSLDGPELPVVFTGRRSIMERRPRHQDTGGMMPHTAYDVTRPFV